MLRRGACLVQVNNIEICSDGINSRWLLKIVSCLEQIMFRIRLTLRITHILIRVEWPTNLSPGMLTMFMSQLDSGLKSNDSQN